MLIRQFDWIDLLSDRIAVYFASNQNFIMLSTKCMFHFIAKLIFAAKLEVYMLAFSLEVVDRVVVLDLFLKDLR